jgi:cell division protein FtsB
MAKAVKTRGGVRRAPVRRRSRHGRPRLHFGRLALLVLVLIAAAFYVSPLRAFFVEQDRHQRETAALEGARAENARMQREIELLSTKSYVAQVAHADSQLVPPGAQVFVVKGLPGRGEEDALASPDPQVAESSFSVLDRIEDLWRTLFH